MKEREHSAEMLNGHLEIRKLIVTYFSGYDNFGASKFLEMEAPILENIEAVKNIAQEKDIKNFYQVLEYLTRSICFLVRWVRATLNAQDDPGKYLIAARSNVSLCESLLQTMDKTRPSIAKLSAIVNGIKQADSIDSVPDLVKLMARIPLPVFYTTQVIVQPFQKHVDEESNGRIEENEPPIVMSVLFFIDNELWANPQTLKKDHQYSIKGKLKLNRWPENYHKLVLSPVSTTNDDWYILSLPSIKATSQLETEIDGSILFKYVQANFETPITIKLIGQFISDRFAPVYADIIGYYELKVKVVDLHSFPYLTGNDKLNQKAYDIYLQLQKELPKLPKEEVDNFLTLLSAILNYQGYCAQHGEYRNETVVAENDFRDRLIRYLSANPAIGSAVDKEAHLAGGRVDISFKGIIAELKVEGSIKDRAKLIEKYSKQASAYATANSSQLSVVCILDTNKKDRPPALAANNIFLVTPEFHGFENIPPASGSRIAVVIIDANMSLPSKY